MTNFSMIEIDDAPAKDAEDMTADELHKEMVAEGFQEPVVDPIQAFADRMKEAREERMAQEAADRAARQVAEADVAAKTAERTSSYVAVAQADQSTGAVIYWQLHSDVDAQVLATAWNDAGLDLDLLPNSPSPDVALNRAVKELQSRNVLIRQHPAGGWALVHERTVEGRLDYAVGARVHLSKEGEIKVEPAAYQDQGQADATAVGVRDSFVKHQSLLSTTDISSALVNVAAKLGAVGLRDRGGIYFVPRESMDTFHTIKGVFSAVTAHIIHEIPAMKSDETVAAIVDALRREVQDVVGAVEGEMSQEMGTRAAANRVKDVQALKDKVSDYELLLNFNLGDTQTKLQELVGKLGNKSSWVTQIEI